MRIEQHIAYAGLIGQQHHHAIDAAAESAIGRHSVAHSFQVVLIERRGLVGFFSIEPLHVDEARLLIARVIELGESVAHLHAGDEEFEALGVALDIAPLLFVRARRPP